MFQSLLLACLPLAFGVPQPTDLSHYFDEDTIYWGGSTPFQFTKVITKGTTDDWYAANEFEGAEHGGTHLDAPYHFFHKGWQVGDIPLERFIGQAVHLDLRTKVKDNANYEVSAEDFEVWEKQYGVMPKGAIVLLNFGWTDKYTNKTKYFGTDEINNTASYYFPGLSEGGAKWLVETDKVFGVGTDAASIDFGQSRNFWTHRLLSEHNIYILEHVAFPNTSLPPTGYQVLALPMKIRHGTGAPCRVLALSSQITQNIETKP